MKAVTTLLYCSQDSFFSSRIRIIVLSIRHITRYQRFCACDTNVARSSVCFSYIGPTDHHFMRSQTSFKQP